MYDVSSSNSNKDVIVISKDMPKLTEGHELVIFKYKNKSQPQRTLRFVMHDDNGDLFLLINRTTFGSAFLGNLVLPRPQYVIAVKYDPVLMLMNIFCNGINMDKSVEGKFVQLDTIVRTYHDEHYSEEEVEFVRKVLMKHEDKLKMICEVNRIDEGLVMYKLLKSKCVLYLNNKIKREDGMDVDVDGDDKEGGNIVDEKALIVCETIEKTFKDEYINGNEYLKKLFKMNENKKKDGDDNSNGKIDNRMNDSEQERKVTQKKGKNKKNNQNKTEKPVSKNQQSMDGFVVKMKNMQNK